MQNDSIFVLNNRILQKYCLYLQGKRIQLNFEKSAAKVQQSVAKVQQATGAFLYMSAIPFLWVSLFMITPLQAPNEKTASTNHRQKRLTKFFFVFLKTGAKVRIISEISYKRPGKFFLWLFLQIPQSKYGLSWHDARRILTNKSRCGLVAISGLKIQPSEKAE